MTGDFTTVFQIAGGNTAVQGPDRLTFLTVGIAVVAVGILLLVLRIVLHSRLRVKFFTPILFMLWGFLWLGFSPAVLRMCRRADRLYADYQNHRYEVVEGTVEVLREQPKGGHAPGDLIRIGGREFEINYFLMTPAYRQTISHGGALRDGVYARLCHKSGHILRVDIRAWPSHLPEGRGRGHPYRVLARGMGSSI